ncbi:type VI secretion system tip protein VgrG [Neolewinella xylanilytica]|uniref:type VI secretion system tip protein VgrG n=1 Tax=Neolewinella xylanilytica TaxID=1514080 RepID=UPI001475266C|nr:type VI secretion system tip protein VgrG [Neolewinella xylanilytica]
MKLSNDARSGQILTITVLLDGRPLRDTYDLLSLEVDREINQISKATLTLLLPRADSDSAAFEELTDPAFLPGAAVELQMGYTETEASIFSGIIVGQSLRASGEGRPTLMLRCQDKAIALTGIPKRKSFTDTSDSAAMKEILSAAGLDATVETTPYQHRQLLQYALSDWDFLVTRAEGNGMVVSNTDGKVAIAKPVDGGSARLSLNFSTDVLDFRGDFDTTGQYTSVVARDWDFTTQDYVETSKSGAGAQVLGNLSPTKIAGMLGDRERLLETTGSTDKTVLTGVAEALLTRSRLSSFRGSVTCFGTSAPELNTLLELEGFGDRFDGLTITSRIRHSVREGVWRTEIGFGLSPELFCERHPDLPGRGQTTVLPTVRGLFNGQVVTTYEGNDNKGHIQVTIPALHTVVWARQSAFYATTGKGAFFSPEVGDEVIVSFINDDPSKAVVLGSLYNPQREAPYSVADDKNNLKGLQTRSGITLEMDDEKEIFRLETPAGNKLLLSDEDKSISLIDQHGNAFTMDANGITLKSSGEISATADKTVKLAGTSGVSADSSGGDVTLTGLNVAAEGEIGATLKGKASAEISASGQTTVKGAIVMIN